MLHAATSPGREDLNLAVRGEDDQPSRATARRGAVWHPYAVIGTHSDARKPPTMIRWAGAGRTDAHPAHRSTTVSPREQPQ